MSESRDRSMRRSRGTSRNVVDGKVKLERARPAGQGEQVVFPSEEATREAVLAGVCPCCGKGPFVLLARHTHAQHGIDTKELRDLAGLTYSESITPATHQEERRKIALRLIAEGKLLSPRDGARRPTVVSAAGKERMKRKPSDVAPPCINCGLPARHKDASGWAEPGRVSGGWLKTCSEACAREASRKARMKERPLCVMCGVPVPFERGRPGKAKTCSRECDLARRAKTMRETRRRMIQSDGTGPVPPAT